MRIAIENINSTVKSTELRKVVAAMNKQLGTFAKFWNIQATCQVGASSTADAILYLQKDVDTDGVLGYHDVNASGKPFGVVFTTLAAQLGEPWTVTLSHEVLELAADPEANRYALGVHPTENRMVFYWYEACDAVQDEHYLIDGVAVSNYVLPLYFTLNEEPGTLSKNDFMRATGLKSGALSSMGLAPGGYYGYFDPKSNTNETQFADKRAEDRNAIKQVLGAARRSVKYRTSAPVEEVVEDAPVKARKKKS